MAIRCEDVTARLLELLYEELPEGERAPLQAHIDGCPRCKAELAAFTETRAVARRVLDEVPPARARAAILQAAAAHAAAATPNIATATAAAAAPAARKPRATEAQPSFWDRLRGRWALPTLATVGAIAVFLLASKLLLEPNKAYERGKEAVQPTPTAEAPVAAPVARQEANDDGRAAAELEKRADEAARSRPAYPQPSVARSSAPAAKQAEKDMDDRKLRPVTIGESFGGGKAAKEPARGQHTAAKKVAPGLAGGGSVGSLGGVAPGAGVAKGEKGGSIEDLLNDGSSSSEQRRRFAPPPPARVAAPTADSSRAKSEESAEPAFAPPPPAAPAPKPAKREIAESPVEGYARDEAPMAAEAEADEAKPAKAKAKRARESAEDKAVEKKSAAPVESSAPAVVMRSAPASASKPSVATAPDPLVQRADRLFAEGQWAVAAAAYRDLINRYPRSGDVSRWRQRLVVAERQYAAAEAAKAAKAAPASASPPR